MTAPPPRFRMNGVVVHAVGLAETTDWILDRVATGEGAAVHTINAHALSLARRDPAHAARLATLVDLFQSIPDPNLKRAIVATSGLLRSLGGGLGSVAKLLATDAVAPADTAPQVPWRAHTLEVAVPSRESAVT